MLRTKTILKSKGGLSWINIINADKKEIADLKRKFKFLDEDLADAYGNKFSQRPKYYQRGEYAFLVLHFPTYNTKTRTILSEEVDFFITADTIITTHNSNLKPLIELFNLCSSSNFYRDQYLGNSAAAFVQEIISRLQEYCYPMLDHLSLDVKNIEKNIFSGRERRMVTEILFIKRNILNFRQGISSHKNIVKKMINDKNDFLDVESIKDGYYALTEHTKSIWEILEILKEMIESLEDTNSSLVSFRINDIMRTLTVFSVIVFPLTLLAAIFGMNTINGMPFMNSQYGFWVIILIMLVGSVFMFAFFRYKKWI
jgi:magnesium transporter